MKKFVKLAVLMLSVVALSCILSGCYYQEVTLNYDENNCAFEFSKKCGVSQVFFDRQGVSTETHNGNIYYMNEAKTGRSEVSNIAVNSLYQNLFDGSNYQLGTLTVDSSEWKNGKADLTINLDVFSGFDIESIYNKDLEGMHSFTDLAEQWQNASSSERETLREKWMSQYIFTFNFASPVTQISGPTEWVTINGNTLKLDIGHMLQDGGGNYVFKSAQSENSTGTNPVNSGSNNNATVGNIKGYADLKSNAWYANAVTAAIEYPLMSGYNATKFGPNDTVTFGQLAKIMANWSHANLSKYSTGSRNWAEPAMKWALAQGFFLSEDVCSKGSTTKIDLNKLSVPMTREECIYSMSRIFTSQYDTDGFDYDGIIPDLNKIQKKYQQAIKYAYTFKITSGVDKNGTFNPTAKTTRAQVCQMFYNLGWL